LVESWQSEGELKLGIIAMRERWWKRCFYLLFEYKIGEGLVSQGNNERDMLREGLGAYVGVGDRN
jgi:hypothetical protein